MKNDLPCGKMDLIPISCVDYCTKFMDIANYIWDLTVTQVRLIKESRIRDHTLLRIFF